MKEQDARLPAARLADWLSCRPARTAALHFCCRRRKVCARGVRAACARRVPDRGAGASHAPPARPFQGLPARPAAPTGVAQPLLLPFRPAAPLKGRRCARERRSRRAQPPIAPRRVRATLRVTCRDFYPLRAPPLTARPHLLIPRKLHAASSHCIHSRQSCRQRGPHAHAHAHARVDSRSPAAAASTFFSFFDARHTHTQWPPAPPCSRPSRWPPWPLRSPGPSPAKTCPRLGARVTVSAKRWGECHPPRADSRRRRRPTLALDVQAPDHGRPTQT